MFWRTTAGPTSTSGRDSQEPVASSCACLINSLCSAAAAGIEENCILKRAKWRRQAERSQAKIEGESFFRLHGLFWDILCDIIIALI